MATLAPGDRPREKLERAGPDALGDNELVALVLGHGPSGALATANRLLEASGGVTGLTRVRRHQLLKVPGIGTAQASRVLAAVELGRRTLQAPPEERQRFESAHHVAVLLPRFGMPG
jgi:DNA repair protein RadC